MHREVLPERAGCGQLIARAPPGSTLIQAPDARGRGNIILKVPVRGAAEPEAAEFLVLKLFRHRWPVWQEWTEGTLARLFLGKTGSSPWARYQAERRCLDLWQREGFDVFRRVERPLPAGVEPPAMWLEYCPGRILTDVLRDPAVTWDEKAAIVRRLAGAHGRRHARALEIDELCLVQKHGTTDHAYLAGDRLLTIDLEGHYRPGFPLLEALTRELSSYLRAIAKYSFERHEQGLAAYVAGYPDRALLRRIADWAVHGDTLYRRLSRRSDRRKRPEHGKTAVLERVLAMVG